MAFVRKLWHARMMRATHLRLPSRIGAFGFALACLSVNACGPKEAAAPQTVVEPQKKAEAPVKNWEAEYRSLRSEIQEGVAVKDAQLAALGARLRAVVEHAKDPHLRANACVLAASMYDARKDYKTALSFYRQTIALVPQEPVGYALSALTLAKLKDFGQAVAMQQEVVRRDPDDLQAWLLLGELNVRAKRHEDATKAYAAYETRRTGLLEGLTRKNKQGEFALSAEERRKCVHALSAAPDAGTSLALVYALKSEPDATVRSALVDVMQEQRFMGYLRPLQEWKAQEPDPKIGLQIDGAIKAILADPVKTRPEPGDIAQPKAKGAVVDPQGEVRKRGNAKSDRSAQ